MSVPPTYRGTILNSAAIKHMDPRRQATTRIVSLTRAALDLLPSVLAAIQRASKVLERDVNKDDRALLDGFNFLGLAASSLSLKLSMLRDAGLDAKLAAYALEILEAVEVSVCEEVLECAPSEVCACEVGPFLSLQTLSGLCPIH